MTTRRTHRWRGVVAVALVSGAVGVFAARPALLLVAVVGAVYAAYPHLTEAPTVDYAVERTVSESEPADGETVAVTVTVTNESGERHPDVRVVDGVPPMLTVESGSPRHATALRPGESATFSYDVRAAAGTHHFEPTTVVARDVSGALEVEGTAEARTRLSVDAPAVEVPLGTLAGTLPGDVVTDRGGDGVEFHRVREYRQGDALSRVDWRRYARSRELSTVEFRAERSASVVVCVDARPRAYRAGGPQQPHAVARSVSAAEALVRSLAPTTNSVGLAAFGREPVWIPPTNGIEHATRLRERLASEPTFSAYRPSEPRVDLDDQLRRLHGAIDPNDQVVLLSPVPDRAIVEAVVTLQHEERSLAVISPDPSATETLGERLAWASRRIHLDALRETGARVVEWGPDQPLAQALSRASAGWTQ